MSPSYGVLVIESFLDKFVDRVRFRRYRRHRFVLHPCVHSFRQGANEECVYSVFFPVLLHLPQDGDLVGPGCVVSALVYVILRFDVLFAYVA